MSQPALINTDAPPVVGRVSIEGNRITVDAQPHVMMRLLQMFKASRPVVNPGTYTHRPLNIAKTPDVAKDLDWIMGRYHLECDQAQLKEIWALADRYDRKERAAASGASNTLFRLSPGALEMAEPAREHQIVARNLFREVLRMLLADTVGLGKTISAIATLCEPESRPALVVVPSHLPPQWKAQFARFMPRARVKTVKKPIPKRFDFENFDVVITGYSQLRGLEDVLVPAGFRTIIFDEVQDLRHIDTVKHRVAKALSEKAEYCLGLSATPIYNLGGEIWSVMDVIAPEALGDLGDFTQEWSSGGLVRDPKALHSYLTSQGLMLRRTKKDLGILDPPVTREVITLEGDLEALKEVENVVKLLALSVLRNVVGESDEASRELDWKLRLATGVAKAKAVAAFVKQLVQDGESVVLAGWHRSVYEIWLHELRDCRPVLYTGTESTKFKEAAKTAFVEGQSKVLILSLRSGSGLDGLQHKSHSVVFGELDWSPQVMDQVIGRLDREGQTEPVTAYFLVVDDGSDPFVLDVLTAKRSQSDGIVDGRVGEAEILEDTGLRSDRIRAMAEGFLASIGESLPVTEPETGLHAECMAALRRIALPSNSEAELQSALWEVLSGLLPHAEVTREVRIGERNRLDFLIATQTERIAIECKVEATGKQAVYRQVRRYAQEAGVTGLIVLAPWSGVPSFVVDGIPVTVIDFTKASLRRGGH